MKEEPVSQEQKPRIIPKEQLFINFLVDDSPQLSTQQVQAIRYLQGSIIDRYRRQKSGRDVYCMGGTTRRGPQGFLIPVDQAHALTKDSFAGQGLQPSLAAQMINMYKINLVVAMRRQEQFKQDRLPFTARMIFIFILHGNVEISAEALTEIRTLTKQLRVKVGDDEDPCLILGLAISSEEGNKATILFEELEIPEDLIFVADKASEIREVADRVSNVCKAYY